MNRVDEFELRVADWLEEGPVDAPEGAIEAALGHARSHPRRALSRAALRRRVMSQFGITQAAPRTPRAGWMLAAAAAAVVVVVGGAAIGTDMFGLWKQSQGVPVTPTASPTVAPTLPSPVAVTGSVTYQSTPELGTKDLSVVDRDEWKHRVVRYGISAPDPRIAGTLTETIVYRDFPDDTANFEGTGEIVNAGGSWTLEVNGASASGYAAGVSPRYIASILGTGKGAYAGLVLEGWVSGDAIDQTITGTVRALAPGDATAIVEFIGSSTPDFKKVGDVNQLRDYTFRVAVMSSDPLLEGSGTMVLNADQRADGTETWWGTLTLTPSSSRGWTADLTGGIDGGSRHSLSGRLIGTGEAAGRVLDVTLVSGRGLLFNMVGLASR